MYGSSILQSGYSPLTSSSIQMLSALGQRKWTSGLASSDSALAELIRTCCVVSIVITVFSARADVILSPRVSVCASEEPAASCALSVSALQPVMTKSAVRQLTIKTIMLRVFRFRFGGADNCAGSRRHDTVSCFRWDVVHNWFGDIIDGGK